MVQRIAVGVDGWEGSILASRWAVEEAAAREAVLEPVTAWLSPYDFGEDLIHPLAEEKIAAGAKARMDTAMAEALGDEQGGVVEGSVVHGDAAQALCDRSADADLQVLGSRGHGRFAGLLLGSVSHKCAHQSRRPIVIVPGPRPDPDAPTDS